LSLTPAELERLSNGACALGVALSERALEAVGTYVAELDQWRKSVNLISSGDRDALVERHLLDSLAAVPLLAAGGVRQVADIGSGAGLPGVPIAAALKATRMTLIEPRRKRANFLRSVCRALPDVDLEVVESEWATVPASSPDEMFDAVISRAALSSTELLDAGRRMLRINGLAILFATTQKARLVPPSGGFAMPTAYPYSLPERPASHVLITWRRV
jgi:16S rRNA (guanine527-N7)-methyltransferase